MLLVESIVARGCWNRNVVTDIILSDDDYARGGFIRNAGVERYVRKVCLMEEALISS